ncbi:hypothetical protein XU18_2558 [Perkinsela sp. CCAP 1560/4]|nr:hypothetical protein XU18_4140 [Perkinsela sp. CCAP 1560/4]KNH06657.1 hypothetical protein XU18_2558 [Perkinsela sp. CCAP 1560/4]|eukprot:KNH04652.1 hypothetical protein XU18_4140 [Perkinsela sp. CCAP 1560/4]
MPPKSSTPSIKQARKKQEKIIEDKTFGLKNKNKSKSVQKYIASMTQSLSHSNNPEMKRKMQEAENRRKMKEAKEQGERELAKLFREVNKEKKDDQKEEDPKVFDEATGEYLWQPEDFAQVEHDDRRLEEQLDEKLAEIRKEKHELTTQETFLAWLSKRTSSKVTGTKHAERSKSTGKKLWQEDGTVFVDDDNAADEDEYILAEDDEDCAEEMKNLSMGKKGMVFDASLFDGRELA